MGAYVSGVTYSPVCVGERAGEMRVRCVQVEGWNRPPVVNQVRSRGISVRCVVRPWAEETVKVALFC